MNRTNGKGEKGDKEGRKEGINGEPMDRKKEGMGEREKMKGAWRTNGNEREGKLQCYLSLVPSQERT